MKPTLAAGLKHSFAYTVPENKTVPYTYPESPVIAAMPKVFATGFMVVLMEWTCTQLLEPHLEVGEGSLGTHVDVSHVAATPPGLTVKVDVEVVSVDGRKVNFRVRAHDGVELIGEGRHERVVVRWDRFNAKVAKKARMANSEIMAGG
ncbi:MAG TPA: thioesterase family protein [Pseudolabrys sp.]|nr:thioesterase family protein [Pseudolabrys sp.]